MIEILVGLAVLAVIAAVLLAPLAVCTYMRWDAGLGYGVLIIATAVLMFAYMVGDAVLHLK